MKVSSILYLLAISSLLISQATPRKTKSCIIHDVLKFRTIHLLNYDEENLYFYSPRIVVSLCKPISPEVIKANCNLKKGESSENVIFMHIVEKKYKNCLLFYKEDNMIV